MDKYIVDLCDRLQQASDAETKLRYLDAISTACDVLKSELQLEDQMEIEQESDPNPFESTPTVASDRISNIPAELLLNILKLELSSEHVRRNADLMLVCRKWKDLIGSNPLFWNTIEAKPHSSLRNVENCAKMVEYCISKSGSMPLDLTLDLRRLWDPRNAPHACVGPYLFIKPWEEHYDDDIIQSISETAIESFMSYTSELTWAFIRRKMNFEEQAAALQQGANMGRRGELYVSHMTRWRHFRLFLSEWMDDDYTPLIIEKFSDPAPNLETLHLSHQSEDPAWIYETNEQLYQDAFRGLQGLRDLSVNTKIDLTKFRRGRNSLRSISFVPTTASFACLPNYPNLQTLYLTLDTYDGVPPQVPGTNIVLPQLTNLLIAGDHSAALLTIIDAPNIQRLRLSNDYILDYPASSLLGLVRTLEWDFLFKNEETEKIRQSLSGVLRQCTLLTEFKTRSGNWRPSTDPMRRLIAAILAEHSPTDLRTIVYLIPGDPQFDSSTVLETVTLQSR